jgi:hypothetical protein
MSIWIFITTAHYSIYCNQGPSWSWSYGSWIYNYLCNQCLSPLTLWVRSQFMRAVQETTLCDKVCQWLCNVTFNNISDISWLSVLLVEETGVPGENHRPVASHWQTLSHNVVSCTARMNWLRTHNVSGDTVSIYFLICLANLLIWLYMYLYVGYV